MKPFPEILAPAGSEEQLIAAVRSGADAVYLAADEFNARRNAKNFTAEDFDRAVQYCRERNVKVYAAVNTLVTDEELPKLEALAVRLGKAGIDGVIVQDLAAAAIFARCCPNVSLHASTQMTVHNRAGVRLLKKYGFTRFVPARELSLDEIRQLAGETDLETEVFVHGALCMSVSGCCYISAMLGGRSGNRGLCAQSCRLNFNANGREYALSLKDMSYIDKIHELRDAGVCSLKIEGRMKRPEYAAAAVTACKNARDGADYDRDTLKNVFSRSGFTDGYLTGQRDLTMFGHRTKEDVTAATEKTFATLRTLYAKEKQTVPVDAALTTDREKTTLTVSDGEHTVQATANGGVIPEKAPLSLENAEKNIAKTGATPYYINNFTFDNPDNLYLPAAALNALRRECLEKLAELRKQPPKTEIYTYDYPFPERKNGKGGFAVRFAKAEQCFDGDFDRVFLPVDEICKDPSLVSRFGEKLCAETPSLIFAEDERRFREKLLRLHALGVTTASADNIGQLQMLKETGFTVLGGMGLNILNSAALHEYKKLGVTEATVSFELSAKRIAALQTDLPLTAVVYGYLPLMKYRCCPMKKPNGCAGCQGISYLTDRKSVRFPVLCEQKRYSVLYNSVPLDVCDRKFPADIRKLLYFTMESAEECKKIYQNAKKGALSAEKHTTGLYYRELL